MFSRCCMTGIRGVKGSVIAAVAVIAGLLSSDPALAATSAYLPTIEKVMSGQSSSGSDQVWIRVNGQPANVPADCVYAPYSLFYVADDTALNRDRALAILLTAKLSNRPVNIEFDVLGTAADFWGYGITKCVIRRVTVD